MTDRHLTPEERFEKCFGAVRAQVAENMTAARAWRDSREPSCGRCADSGIIKTWGGRAGEGGRIGPCPRCQRVGAQRFAESMAKELWGGVNGIPQNQEKDDGRQ